MGSTRCARLLSDYDPGLSVRKSEQLPEALNMMMDNYRLADQVRTFISSGELIPKRINSATKCGFACMPVLGQSFCIQDHVVSRQWFSLDMTA